MEYNLGRKLQLIGVRLEGGLGNQLFQYATARALALKFSSDVIADISAYEGRKDRRYLLDRLRARVRPAYPGELAGLRARREKSFGYDASFLEWTDNSLLEGYWQSAHYFQSIRPILLEEIVSKSPPDASTKKISDDILGSPSVSVHVRRGDYAADPETRRYHGLCGLEYYQEAARRLRERSPSARFFLFSDDPDWTGKNLLPLIQGASLVRPHEREEEDLRLMSACSYHIIANSSFSWWGAWLSQSADKIVYAPKQWFAGADLDTSDLIPASWTRI